MRRALVVSAGVLAAPMTKTLQGERNKQPTPTPSTKSPIMAAAGRRPPIDEEANNYQQGQRNAGPQ